MKIKRHIVVITLGEIQQSDILGMIRKMNGIKSNLEITAISNVEQAVQKT